MGRQNYTFSPNFVEIMAKLFPVLLIIIGILPATAQNPSGVKPGLGKHTPAQPIPVKPGATQPGATQLNATQPNAVKPSAVKPGPAKLAPTGTPTITDTAIHFADSIFHTRSIEYEQIETGIPTDIQPILARFNNALVANRSWFEQYKSTYAGQPLPYNSRFGISADEYRRLQSFTPQLVPVDTQKINIIREGGYIRFHCVDSGFQLLDYLQIDLRRQLLVYGADTVPLIGRTSTTAASPYGAWEGFTWRLEKADANSIIASSRVTARVIEINMGLTSPSSPQPVEPAGQTTATQAATPTSPHAPPASPPATPTGPPATPTSPPATQASTHATPTGPPATQASQTAAGSLTQPATPSNPQDPAPAKVFLRIKYQQMKEGTTTANLEMVGYIRQ
jgi:hypothetical protein